MKWLKFVAWVCVIAIICLAVYKLVSQVYTVPKWQPGDLVRTVVGNERVQVVRTECAPAKCAYVVRWSTKLITVEEFELKPDGM